MANKITIITDAIISIGKKTLQVSKGISPCDLLDLYYLYLNNVRCVLNVSKFLGQLYLLQGEIELEIEV